MTNRGTAADPIRNSAVPLAVGERVFLLPRTLGCPTASWRRPRVRITALTEGTATVVELPAGGGPDSPEIHTSRANLARTLPRPRKATGGPESAVAARTAPTVAPLSPEWVQPALVDLGGTNGGGAR